MRTFSFTKFFTPVIFLVITGNAFAAGTSLNCNSEEATEAFSLKCVENFKKQEAKYDAGDLNRCISDKRDQCLSHTNLDKSSCMSAKKDWSDKNSKKVRACSAFDKSLGKSCEEKVNGCQAKIDNTMNPAGSNLSESTNSETGDIMLQLIKTQLSTKSDAIANDVLNGGAPCVKQFDAKTRKADQKDFDRQKADLEEQIEKAKEEQIKDKEKLDEKTAEIQKKIDQLAKDLKKSENDSAKQLSEKTSQASKSTLEASKKIRALQAQITKENQAIATLKLNNATAMFSLTSAEVTKRCKQQLVSLQACILNPAVADPKGTNQCEALNNQLIKGKGVASSSNVSTALQQAKDTCFKAEDDKLRATQLKYSQDLANSNDKITEIKSQIDDENKNLDLAKKDIEAAKAQSEAEKKAADDAMNAESETLSNELKKFQTTTNARMQKAAARVAKLTDDIQKLVLNKNFGVEESFSDASEAIYSAEDARQIAYSACGCETDKSSEQCASLRAADVKVDSSTSSGSTRSKTKK